jgi:nitrogen regulatory protein P-II 2
MKESVMSQHAMKLVTIVTESVLTESLVADLKRLGASGYTVTEVRGEGSRGRRVGEVPGDNRKIEVVAEPDLASAMLDVLANQYFPNYAIVAWVGDVLVVRGDKYAAR